MVKISLLREGLYKVGGKDRPPPPFPSTATFGIFLIRHLLQVLLEMSGIDKRNMSLAVEDRIKVRNTYLQIVV